MGDRGAGFLLQAHVKRPSGKGGAAPVMRPMSASSGEFSASLSVLLSAFFFTLTAAVNHLIASATALQTYVSVCFLLLLCVCVYV